MKEGAGLVAASAQILVATAATVAITIALRCGLVIAASGAAGSELQSAVRLLQWIDVFLAIGIALTRDGFIDETAGRIREIARRSYPVAPDHACKALSVQLTAASAGFALLAFRPLLDFSSRQLTGGDGSGSNTDRAGR